MHTVTYSPQPNVHHSDDMKVGDFARIVNGTYENYIIVRIYADDDTQSRFVSLSSPGITWINVTFEVEIFPPNTIVTIKVGSNA